MRGGNRGAEDVATGHCAALQMHRLQACSIQGFPSLAMIGATVATQAPVLSATDPGFEMGSARSSCPAPRAWGQSPCLQQPEPWDTHGVVLRPVVAFSGPSAEQGVGLRGGPAAWEAAGAATWAGLHVARW